MASSQSKFNRLQKRSIIFPRMESQTGHKIQWMPLIMPNKSSYIEIMNELKLQEYSKFNCLLLLFSLLRLTSVLIVYQIGEIFNISWLRSDSDTS